MKKDFTGKELKVGDYVVICKENLCYGRISRIDYSERDGNDYNITVSLIGNRFVRDENTPFDKPQYKFEPFKKAMAYWSSRLVYVDESVVPADVKKIL